MTAGTIVGHELDRLRRRIVFVPRNLLAGSNLFTASIASSSCRRLRLAPRSRVWRASCTRSRSAPAPSPPRISTLFRERRCKQDQALERFAQSPCVSLSFKLVYSNLWNPWSWSVLPFQKLSLLFFFFFFFFLFSVVLLLRASLFNTAPRRPKPSLVDFRPERSAPWSAP